MKPFVIIFRQGGQSLTDADLKKRSEETRAWAQHQNATGHKLEPRILAPESQWCSPDGNSDSTATLAAGPLTALLFLEADDLDQAVDIARSHPGFRYGASVEIRPWGSPTVPQ